MNSILYGFVALALARGKSADCISGRKVCKGTQSTLHFAYFASHALQPRSTRRTAALVAVLALSVAGAAPAAPVDYRFDPVHSHLQFAADHMGFSTSIGRFTRWQGGFSYDPDDPSASRVDVTIDIASLDLGDANWNKTMLGRKWFDAEHFPQAHFVGNRFEPVDATHARLHGDLTLKGRTQPVTLQVRINRFGTHPYTLKATAGFSATTTLSRSAFGLDALDGTLADAVEIRIEVEGQRAKPLQHRPGKR